MGPKKQIAIKGGKSSSRPKNLARKRKRTPEPDEVTLGRSPTPSPPFSPSPLSPSPTESELAQFDHIPEPKVLWKKAAIKQPRNFKLISDCYPKVSIIIL